MLENGETTVPSDEQILANYKQEYEFIKTENFDEENLLLILKKLDIA